MQLTLHRAGFSEYQVNRAMDRFNDPYSSVCPAPYVCRHPHYMRYSAAEVPYQVVAEKRNSSAWPETLLLQDAVLAESLM